MPGVQVGTRIQLEVGLDKLHDSRTYVRGETQVVQENLELASAQLALGMSAVGVESEVPTLRDRILEWNEGFGDEVNDGRWFTAEDLLTEHELAFLPAARTIVGLTYGAARQFTMSRTEVGRSY